MEMIANSKPNPATDAALADARKVPEVESYFRATASNRAKQLNRMSAREFEEFSRSPLQQPCLPATLTNKNTEDLMREQINIANLNNWLVLKPNSSWRNKMCCLARSRERRISNIQTDAGSTAGECERGSIQKMTDENKTGGDYKIPGRMKKRFIILPELVIFSLVEITKGIYQPAQ